MRILNTTAQKPDSTGSGVYLSELMKGFEKHDAKLAVIYGTVEGETAVFSESVERYPVYYSSDNMPFPILGMSDEMPYESTRYRDLTPEMVQCFRNSFGDAIDKAVSEFKPDVILCHHLYLLTALIREKIQDIPVYAVCHGTCLRQLKKNPVEREYIKENVRKIEGFLALHEEQKKEICELFDVPESKVTVIGTGYNSNVFNIDPDIRKETSSYRIMFAGKVSHKKGVMSMIKASNLLPDSTDISIAIAGGAGNREEYDAIVSMAEKSKRKIDFLGKLNQHDLSIELQKSHAFILPSFFEGLPLVIIEAMASGLPVICTDLPGIRPWVRKAGLLDHVIFVEPPELVNTDEPVESTLPGFEEDLKNAMLEIKKVPLPVQEKVKKLSWNGLSDRLYEMFINIITE
ncbi:MAG: glycosyltransferase family 4 protein [Clostridia bacterium]|nr:glycosyltransferase family 4 protein [Clostridia bacterium]